MVGKAQSLDLQTDVTQQKLGQNSHGNTRYDNCKGSFAGRDDDQKHSASFRLVSCERLMHLVKRGGPQKDHCQSLAGAKPHAASPDQHEQ